MEHLVIPDCQVTPSTPTDHLKHCGRLIVDRQPDVIVCIGDFADMESLSSYDRDRSDFHSRRYQDDVQATKDAMDILLGPMREFNNMRARNRKAQYRPRMIMTLGNHENRINRALERDRVRMEGALSTDDLGYSEAGWEVYPFLEVVEIDGIRYSHFFPRSPSGRILQSYRGAPNARLQVMREMSSCTSGHLQGLDIHHHMDGNRLMWGVIAGSFYSHDEEYLTPQGTNYWRGVIYKHNVDDGNYDLETISLDTLARNYAD